MPDTNPWLKAMENGGLGEARARALLMERFWVLERSVDVEGADYLIQRRLTAANFLDKEPPRLGVVQVKFVQDGNTYIRVHRDYVTDQLGSPYGEFFLLVFTGRESDQRSFLLSSQDMLKEFAEIDEGGTPMLRLRGDKLLIASNYEVTKPKTALDRIEHALKIADFGRNRRFIGGTSYVKLDIDQIDHDLTIENDNGYDDIPKAFLKSKQKLQSTLFDVERIAEALTKILRSTDPIEALRIYEDEIADHVGRGGFGEEIGIRIDFFDEDFIEVVKTQRARLAKLRELGLEGNYFKLIETFDSLVARKILALVRKKDLPTVKISVSYDEDTLADASFAVVPATLKAKQDTQILASKKGAQRIILRIPEKLHDMDTDKRQMLLKKQFWRIRRPFQRELDKLYLGEDLVFSFWG